MSKLERIAFFLLLISIPIQLGKHFWPNFAFIQGVRVDYLSPTLYISDIFFIVLFCLSIFRLKRQLLNIFLTPLFSSVFLVLLAGGLFSSNREAAFFGIIKFFELFYIAFYTALSFKKKDLSLFIFLSTLGALVETIILFFQFTSQSSLGGPFYFLGERTFNLLTPGIATFQWGDRLILRPYGTFPHPNVLAFYLLFCFSFLLFSVDFRKVFESALKLTAIFFIALGIFFTFSRVIFLLLFGVVFVWFFIGSKKTKRRMKLKLFLPLSLIFIIALFLFSQRLESSFIRDSALRLSLSVISLNIFSKHVLLGVGLNNFYYYEILFQKNVSPTLLQPVHNIYLLWLVQTGILGFGAACFFIIKIFASLKQKISSSLLEKNFYQLIFLLLFCCGVIGFFDHYLLTLQQAELIVSIIFGLSYAKVMKMKS